MALPPTPVKVAVEKPRINALVYGNPGVGKTLLAASAQDHPDLRDVLFLNIEGGLLTISAREDIFKVDVRSAAEIEAVFWALRDGHKDYQRFKTVCFDSATELQQVNLEEIVRSEIQKNPSATKNKDRSVSDIYLEDYGTSTNNLKRLFRWFRDLNMNVIITALSKSTYEKTKPGQPQGALVDVRPSLTDKLCDSVMGYQDFVWYMYKTDNGDRHLLTQEVNKFKAKTREPNFAAALGTVVDNPSLPTIYELLCRSKSEVFTPRKEAIDVTAIPAAVPDETADPDSEVQ